MPTSDCEFPPIAKRGHRPRFGRSVRVPLPTSFVDPSTLAEIASIMKRTGLSRGIVIDRLVAFAIKRGAKIK